MIIHELKTIQPYFNDVERGIKNFEFRKNDRDFVIWDFLILREYFTESKKYSERYIVAEISYILKNYPGIEDGFCILGISVIDETELDFPEEVSERLKELGLLE